MELKRVTDKLKELVGSPVMTDGKPDFTKTKWKSEIDRQMFITWLASEMRRDVKLWRELTGRQGSSRPVKLCERAANEFEWAYGPKMPE